MPLSPAEHARLRRELAHLASEAVLDAVVQLLDPFLSTRVMVYVARVTRIDETAETVTVSFDTGDTAECIWQSPTLLSEIEPGQSGIVLYDTQTGLYVFDDVIETANNG